jgi:hypothetical protein
MIKWCIQRKDCQTLFRLLTWNLRGYERTWLKFLGCESLV